MAGLTSTAQQLVAAVPDHLKRRIYSARELSRRRQEAVRPEPMGVESIDRLLGGGVSGGHLIEILGRHGSGRFSLALTILAAITTRGETAALVDLGDTLDPQNAADIGVDLERLLWVRPPHLKPALHAAESIVGAGFPLVVIDLGIPPVPGGRGAEIAWLRLARSVSRQQTTLVVTTPYRTSGTAAATVLRTAAERPHWSGDGTSPRLLEGLRSHVELVKSRIDSRNAALVDSEGRALASTVSPLSDRHDSHSSPVTPQRTHHAV